MTVSDDRYDKADDLLNQLSMAADSLDLIGFGLLQKHGQDSEDGNAVLYLAESMKEKLEEARELLYGE